MLHVAATFLTKVWISLAVGGGHLHTSHWRLQDEVCLYVCVCRCDVSGCADDQKEPFRASRPDGKGRTEGAIEGEFVKYVILTNHQHFNPADAAKIVATAS